MGFPHISFYGRKYLKSLSSCKFIQVLLYNFISEKLKVETTTLYMLKFARVTLDNIFPALGNKMFNDNLAHRPMRTSISNMI